MTRQPRYPAIKGFTFDGDKDDDDGGGGSGVIGSGKPAGDGQATGCREIDFN